jgi:transcriptional regulator with XRE-family HTH domain
MNSVNDAHWCMMRWIAKNCPWYIRFGAGRHADVPLNLVGPQVRKLRDQKNWTQDLLAQKLQLTGWDVSRTSLAKLEAQLRWVSDVQILFLARVLGVDVRVLPLEPFFIGKPRPSSKLAPSRTKSVWILKYQKSRFAEEFKPANYR